MQWCGDAAPSRRLSWSYLQKEGWRLTLDVANQPFAAEARLVSQPLLYPGVEGRYQIERDGSASLIWSLDGVYYRIVSLDLPEADLVAIALDLLGGPHVGAPAV